jgi:enamine deaminase RidA (YjgF/YER057c/UK114 family)
VSGAPVHYAECAGGAGAAWFADGAARYCHVGGVVPDGVSLPRQRQATAVFEALPDALQACGVGFGDVARTWFYLDEILAWYDEFNDVRDDFFARHRVHDGLVPASTGIGMANAAGTAVAAEAVAIRPLEDDVEVRPVASPGQNSPAEYGSSFSRAVEAALPDHRRLYVSGTASIDREGRTVREGDFEGQLEKTLSVVEKILEARRMDWDDVTRAVAYARRPGDMAAARQEMDRYPMPVVTVPAVVCRDNLLFELEVDAISTAD